MCHKERIFCNYFAMRLQLSSATETRLSTFSLRTNSASSEKWVHVELEAPSSNSFRTPFQLSSVPTFQLSQLTCMLKTDTSIELLDSETREDFYAIDQQCRSWDRICHATRSTTVHLARQAIPLTSNLLLNEKCHQRRVYGMPAWKVPHTWFVTAAASIADME